MSQENVELVLGSMPAADVDIAPLFRDDEMWAKMSAAWAPVLHADFRCSVALFGSEISYGVGIDGLRTLWLDWLAPWATYRTETEQAIDLGDRVLWVGMDFGCRKGSRGDVKREAIRCLKRHLVRTIYNTMTPTLCETPAAVLALT
jgi:hypothetical protein